MKQIYTKQLIVALIIVLALLGIVLISENALNSTGNTSHQTSRKEKTADQSGGNDPAKARDDTRHNNAITLASRLLTQIQLLQKEVPESAEGLDMIINDREGNPLTDPSTGTPYVFNYDQSTLVVGQVTFRLAATCDDKIEGSDGKGKIIPGSDKSAAVAIKLESGGFACQSNL